MVERWVGGRQREGCDSGREMGRRKAEIEGRDLTRAEIFQCLSPHTP